MPRSVSTRSPPWSSCGFQCPREPGRHSHLWLWPHGPLRLRPRVSRVEFLTHTPPSCRARPSPAHPAAGSWASRPASPLTHSFLPPPGPSAPAAPGGPCVPLGLPCVWGGDGLPKASAHCRGPRPGQGPSLPERPSCPRVVIPDCGLHSVGSHLAPLTLLCAPADSATSVAPGAHLRASRCPRPGPQHGAPSSSSSGGPSRTPCARL